MDIVRRTRHTQDCENAAAASPKKRDERDTSHAADEGLFESSSFVIKDLISSAGPIANFGRKAASPGQNTFGEHKGSVKARKSCDTSALLPVCLNRMVGALRARDATGAPKRYPGSRRRVPRNSLMAEPRARNTCSLFEWGTLN